MPTGNLRFKGKPANNAGSHRPRQNHQVGKPNQADDEDLGTYIRIFIDNGLKLQSELMVNKEAVADAQRQHLAEFHRKT